LCKGKLPESSCYKAARLSHKTGMTIQMIMPVFIMGIATAIPIFIYAEKRL